MQNPLELGTSLFLFPGAYIVNRAQQKAIYIHISIRQFFRQTPKPLDIRANNCLRTKLCSRIAEKQGIDRRTIEQPTSAFFLKYNGEPITRTNVQRLLKGFLNKSGLGSLRISCNTSRHDAARIQYERFFSASYQEYSPVDKDLAVLEGHKPRTQLLNYNDNYIVACATAYHKLQVFADEEARKHAERVDRVCRMVHIVDLGLSETAEDESSEHSSSSSDDDDDDEGNRSSCSSVP
ncbi:unnamed protein product [Cylicostephanus goldi]|uniref:Uncharacterized protein n=1 Tax=Cylicostephanus goldi TaxID=71465 RepID=A0A3P6QTR6_CYLGO|nr:unnamed protein product [Cylicostephanus goldi]